MQFLPRGPVQFLPRGPVQFLTLKTAPGRGSATARCNFCPAARCNFCPAAPVQFLTLKTAPGRGASIFAVTPKKALFRGFCYVGLVFGLCRCSLLRKSGYSNCSSRLSLQMVGPRSFTGLVLLLCRQILTPQTGLNVPKPKSPNAKFQIQHQTNH